MKTGLAESAPAASITRTAPVVSWLKKSRPSGAKAILTGVDVRPVATVSTWKPGSSETNDAGRAGVTWTDSGAGVEPSALEATTV